MSVDTLRETFHINRIATEDLEDFLTAQTYRPEITAARNKVKSLSHVGLQTVCDTPIRQGQSPKYVEGDGLTCIKPKNTRDLIVDLADCDAIDAYTANEVRRQKLEYGDVVITRSGSGTIGRASIFTGSGDVYTNDHLFIVRVSEADGFYVGAFLKSYWGERLLEAGISGSTGQLNLSNEHIKQITLYQPGPQVQKYIGNKVRQAERLRLLASFSARRCEELISTTQMPNVEYSERYSRVNPNLLTHMLTATTYKKEYVENQKFILDNGGEVRSLTSYFNSITNGYDERQELAEGIPYVKVAEVRPGFIDTGNAGRVHRSKISDASDKQRPVKGDLLLTRKGSFGFAAVVMSEEPFLASSEVFVCKPKDKSQMPLLAAFINSAAGYKQFRQYSTGTTMPGINQGNLSNVFIPDFEGVDTEEFNQLHKTRYVSACLSKSLTLAARKLVELLIDGALTEQQIADAQMALEADDTSFDRDILARLTTKGLDGDGGPLFDDLDQLYELLAQSQQMDE